MNKTGISWTDLTWNPVSGCSKVSPGCKHCYAEALSKRWGRSFDVTLHPEKLKEVRKIPSGSKVFVNSMSDLFHDKVLFPKNQNLPNFELSRPFAFLTGIFMAMETRPDVTFQILTKRPENVLKFWINMAGEHGPEYIDRWAATHWKHILIGTSIEMKLYAEKRIPALRSIPVLRKFISFEPLLGDIGNVNLSGINWIIIGGESGPHHRPMKIEWARNLVRQAKDQGVAVWMKQLGGIRPGGDLEDFPEDSQIREFPKEVINEQA